MKIVPQPNNPHTKTYKHTFTLTHFTLLTMAAVATRRRVHFGVWWPDSLEKPKPTLVAVYTKGSSTLIDSKEEGEAPMERPRRLLFRKRKSKPKHPRVVALIKEECGDN